MEQINTIRTQALEYVSKAQTLSELNDARVRYLGKKGEIQALMKEMKSLPKEEKPAFGAAVNELKQEVSQVIEERKIELEELEMNKKIENEKIDISLPGRQFKLGNKHPLRIVQEELEDLFVGLGYQVIEGNDIVNDEYCFERANIPKDHPARAMQDSLYIDPEWLLRTYDSYSDGCARGKRA